MKGQEAKLLILSRKCTIIVRVIVDRYALHHNSGHSPALVAFLLTHIIRVGMLSILRAPYGLNIRWKVANVVGNHGTRPFTYF